MKKSICTKGFYFFIPVLNFPLCFLTVALFVFCLPVIQFLWIFTVFMSCLSFCADFIIDTCAAEPAHQ